MCFSVKHINTVYKSKIHLLDYCKNKCIKFKIIPKNQNQMSFMVDHVEERLLPLKRLILI